MGGRPHRAAMAALSLTATVYVGCILDRGAELTEDPASSTGGNTGTGGLGGFGNMGGTTTQGGDGGVPTGGGGTGGMPTGGGGSGGVLNGGGGSGGEPMPTDVNDCILWLRADLGAPTTGDVALWENQCGAPGDDATQTNPAWRPEAMATGGPSMMPAMAFDPATSDHMNLTLTSTSSDYTLFAVLNQQSAAATQALITTDDTAGAYYHFTAVDPPGNGNFVAVNQGTTNYECIGAVTGEQWLSWRLDSVAQTFTCARHDGNSATITNWTGPWSWSTSPFLGSSKPGNNNLDALLSEVILYERALTSNEMQLVEAYLMNRYGAL